MMLNTKYQGPRRCGFRREDFFTFYIYKPKRRAGPFFWPQDYNLNTLGRGPLGDAKNQISIV